MGPTWKLLFTRFYDGGGRTSVTVIPGKPDPREQAIDAFFGCAAPSNEWKVAYGLAKVWSPEVHERCMQRLAGASDEHWFAYLDDVLEHTEHHDSWGPTLTLLLSTKMIGAFRQRESTSAWAKKTANLPELSEHWFLGKDGISDVFSHDANHRVFMVEKGGAAATLTPLTVALSSTAITRSLRPYSSCDDRRLYYKGKHIFWVYQRYQTALYLIGSQFFPERDGAEITLEMVVQCPDMSWVKRVEHAFLASLPSGMRKTGNDPFFSEELGAVYFRDYHASGGGPGGGSRGVWGNKLMNAGMMPGVMRLKMDRAEEDSGPWVEAEFGSRCGSF